MAVHLVVLVLSMFTANSMNCLCEVLGLALPGNGSILAIDPRREELIKQAAEKLKILIERDIKPRDIVTEEAIDDAFALDMAIGRFNKYSVTYISTRT